MKNTNQRRGLWTVQFGELGATLKTLQDNGVTVEHLARIRAEPDYAKRVAKFILQGDLVVSIHQKIARAILGKNFFGVEEWSSFYGVNFSNKQLREIDEFPWNEDVLNTPCPFYKDKSIKETHFVFLGLNSFKGEPLTILKWQKIHPILGQPRFYSYTQDCWYAKEDFSISQTCNFRWYLMPMEIVPDSIKKTYEEQVETLSILSTKYEVPLAIEEITKIILYHRKNGIYLNHQKCGRCRDVTSNNERVHVGEFKPDFLFVSCLCDNSQTYYIGLAASRKF